MTWLRGLGQDLIDKRLWPIALVLVVAIIAAPSVLARVGGGGDAAVVPTPVEGTDGLRAAVVETAEPGDGPTEGSLRNPFYNPPDPEQPEGETQAEAGTPAGGDAGTQNVSTGGTTPSGSSDGSSGSSGGGDSGSSGGGDSGSSDSSSKGSGESGYDLTIRFGDSEKDLETLKDLPRLTPIPSADDPVLVYMGVLDDNKTAVFLVASEIASVVGDGTCRPTEDACETLELKPGETQFLDVTPPAPGTETPAGGDEPAAQYQLDVVKLVKRGSGGGKASTASKKKAKKAKKVRKAGKAAVRKARRSGAADTLDRYRFDAADGVIRRLTVKQVARAAGAGGLRVKRTGLVVSSGALQG